MGMWSSMYARGGGETIRKEDIYGLESPSVIDANQLEEMLRKGIVHFKYRKKPKKGQPIDSGEEREAWGTKKMDIIEDIPHNGDCPPKGVGYIPYFDVEKGTWRVYHPTRILGVGPRVFTDEEYFENIYPLLKGDK